MTVAYIAGAVWLAGLVAMVAIIVRALARPVDSIDLYCAEVDAELDARIINARRDAIIVGWLAAGSGADAIGWSWPANPADATHGHPEFRPGEWAA